MKLIITKHNLGLWAANQVAQRINETNKNPFVLGLPTGGTVEDMYAAFSGKASKSIFQKCRIV